MDNFNTDNPLLSDLTPSRLPPKRNPGVFLALLGAIGFSLLLLMGVHEVQVWARSQRSAPAAQEEYRPVERTVKVEEREVAPEPGTLVLLGTGAAAAFVIWRRRK